MANVNRPKPHSKLSLDLLKPMNMSAEEADATWKKLEHAIGEIHNQNASGLSFEELYRRAYSMVLHRYGAKLYAGMEDCLTVHLQKIAAALEGLSGSRFMQEVLNKWAAYHKSTRLIRDILMYMDRTYVQHLKKTSVYDRGMQLWTEEIIRHPAIGPLLRELLLEQIAKERGGEVINRQTMKSMTKMLLELGTDVYLADFETPFLDASKQFFKAEVQRCLATTDCPQYWMRVEGMLASEEERVRAYLDPATTEQKLLCLIDQELIRSQMHVVLQMENSGLVYLLENDKHEDLARIYKLCLRIGTEGHSFLKAEFHKHVKEKGKALVADQEATKDPVVFVQKLLDLRDKYTTIIEQSFQQDRQFHQELNLAFEMFLHTFSRAPEYISLFLDNKLRKCVGTISDEEADKTLDKVLQLFRYLQDKDVFERFYKQHLGKRLLMGKVTSDDTERSLLSKLKTECGYQFTSKLEQMFTDIKTSQDTMNMFKAYLTENRVTLSCDLNVQVLTTGSWPTATTQKCNLPVELEQSTMVFQEFYRKTHSGRNLAWHTSMGTADLKATFSGRRKELNVTTYQMCVLMLFNDQDEITFSELQSATQICRDELKRALQGLCMVKGKNLLKKAPMGKEIADSDTFFVNESFDSKLYKIKFAAAGAVKESDPERGTRGRVEEDRKHHIEAAIVRIMKARKVLDYNSVITEVTRQLQGRFMPQPTDIKKRMESLIEREFIERDALDRKMYRYMA